MLTCVNCGKDLMSTCSCFSPRQRLGEYRRLFARQLEAIDKVQFENKPLYMQLEHNKIRKRAKVRVLHLFGIEASAEFSSKEIGQSDEFVVSLLDWDLNLIRRWYEHRPKFSFFKRYIRYSVALEASSPE